MYFVCQEIFCLSIIKSNKGEGHLVEAKFETEELPIEGKLVVPIVVETIQPDSLVFTRSK